MLQLLKQKIKKRFISFFTQNYVPQLNKCAMVNMDYVLSYSGQKERVVYTCLTGNYDILPLNEYLDYSYDYICFTDNQNLLQMKRYGAWEIRPLLFSELDNQLNNRWHKTHPHILFPEYKESIYVDSNISFLTDYIFTTIDSMEKDIIIPIHDFNYCVYEEAAIVKKRGFDKPDNIDRIVSLLKEAGFPSKYGLNENCLIFRKHHQQKIIDMMEEWWIYIRDYCRRDQLSLVYILWKNNIKPRDIAIPNIRKNVNNIQFYGHNKK